ncbi:MAG: hypothetical protein ABR592_10730 [Nitriliruptorales bacterium]
MTGQASSMRTGLGQDSLRLPDFIIIGAMKSGTSSLASYLASHPDVFITNPKEPEFFVAEGNWDRASPGTRSC